jgi:hypothetical protein
MLKNIVSNYYQLTIFSFINSFDKNVNMHLVEDKHF